MTNLKVGDLVKIKDGSYAVRVDKYEEYTFIGTCSDTFEVISTTHNKLSNSRGSIIVHNIFIKNINTREIYLHSSSLVEKFERCIHCNRCIYCGK